MEKRNLLQLKESIDLLLTRSEEELKNYYINVNIIGSHPNDNDDSHRLAIIQQIDLSNEILKELLNIYNSCGASNRKSLLEAFECSKTANKRVIKYFKEFDEDEDEGIDVEVPEEMIAKLLAEYGKNKK